MTELSGGQTRSLLIADAVVIGNSPIILLDEIENAGIHKTKALELLKKYCKAVCFRNTRSDYRSFFRLQNNNEKRCNAENCLFKLRGTRRGPGTAENG
jgi:hypothetical protein